MSADNTPPSTPRITQDPDKGDTILDLRTATLNLIDWFGTTIEESGSINFISYGDAVGSIDEPLHDTGRPRYVTYENALNSDIFLQALTYRYLNGWTLNSLTHHGGAIWKRGRGSDEAVLVTHNPTTDKWVLSRTGLVVKDRGSYETEVKVEKTIAEAADIDRIYATAIAFMRKFGAYQNWDENPDLELSQTDIDVLTMPFDQLCDQTRDLHTDFHGRKGERIRVIEVVHPDGQSPCYVRYISDTDPDEDATSPSGINWLCGPLAAARIRRGEWTPATK